MKTKKLKTNSTHKNFMHYLGNLYSGTNNNNNNNNNNRTKEQANIV